MAKINHNNYLDTINELSIDGRRRGILHLFTDEMEFTGRNIYIQGKELLNFGTCGYLGLETDPRLIKGSIEYTEQFGTQFSVSRTFVSAGRIVALEELLHKMYGKPVIAFPSTSSAHISIIPSIVRERHAIILDQQVHMSVQTGAQLLRQRGTPIEMIRHSNLEMLERKLAEFGNKYDKVWYMIDGVYSMYGDFAPIHDLLGLLKKYDQLHLYIDDAHGMSWWGKNGAGYIFEEAGLNDKMVLVTTMAKGFGVVGGIGVFPNEKVFEMVKNFGGPLTYSHPLPPPLLGAAVASAKIHLSDDIYRLQRELRSKLAYSHKVLTEKNLPVLSDPQTPIFFVGMGQPKVGYNMVKRMLDEGFYVNVGIFPAVPVKNTGLRFTINRHQTLEDIKGLADAIAYHFPRALEDEKHSENEVRRAFHLPLIKSPANVRENRIETNEEYTVQHETSITKIDREEWNSYMEKEGTFDWDGLLYLEQSYKYNTIPENSWDFHYYIVRNSEGRPLLITFVTITLFKDDLLAPASVSLQLEEKRKQDPYYLTTKTICMGSLMTEGNHLFIDRSNKDWRNILRLFLSKLSQLQDFVNAPNVMLRDFDVADSELRDFFIEEGFVKITMPNSNEIRGANWNTYEEFIDTLSARNRRHTRRDVIRWENYFEHETVKSLPDEMIDKFYNMYMNVKRRNLAINHFPYTKESFALMNTHPNWEFNLLYVRPEYEPQRPLVTVLASYRNKYQYSPAVLGMDYDYVFKYNSYKQALFQSVVRARKLGIENIFLGFSADTEKRKLGANQYPRVAFVQAKDNFNFEVIESMSVIDAA